MKQNHIIKVNCYYKAYKSLVAGYQLNDFNFKFEVHNDVNKVTGNR